MTHRNLAVFVVTQRFSTSNLMTGADISEFTRGVFLHNLWRDLYKEIDTSVKSFEMDAELRLTGLMTSPGPEVAKEKLGRYLQEAESLRKKKRHKAALVLTLVSAEYYWRHHQSTRAIGILLEASDLFFLIGNLQASQRCLETSLTLMTQELTLKWWEKELIGSIFLLSACNTIINDPAKITVQLNKYRNILSEKQQNRLSREDGYRVAIALRRAIGRQSLTPLDELESKATLRTSSEYSTLYEYLQGMSERYVLIRDGLITLRREIHQEET